MQRQYTDPRRFAFGRRSRVIAFAGLVVTCFGVLFGAPSCLITGSPPQLPTPQGIIAGGSCICATCLDKKFCMNAAGNFKIDTAADPCMDDPNFPIMVDQATQVASMTTRSMPFYCVPSARAGAETAGSGGRSGLRSLRTAWHATCYRARDEARA